MTNAVQATKRARGVSPIYLSEADQPFDGPAAESGNMPMNRSLHAAKAAKQDEFYTQYVDIQKEVEAYLEFDPDTFRGKVVYCNCDDPFESNFFKYFAANFNKLALKKLVTTSYDGSPIAGHGTLFPEYNEGNGKRQKPKALAVTLDHVKDEDGDGAANIDDVELFLKRNKAARKALKGNDEYPGGDFRSAECIALMKESDIVVTNPPFSLFREYIATLVEHGKKFLIIGNMNAITYKEVFPLLQDNKVWLGNNCRVNGGAMFYEIPEAIANLEQVREIKTTESGRKVFITRVQGVRWFTNLDHGRHHEPIQLMTMADVVKFGTKKPFDKYDNYDAIEVPFVKYIPRDYPGVIGVPISFFDKYNPDQFEIVGTTESNDPDNAFRTRVYTSGECRAAYLQRFGKPGVYDLNASGVVNGIKVYKRVLIRRRARPSKGKKK